MASNSSLTPSKRKKNDEQSQIFSAIEDNKKELTRDNIEMFFDTNRLSDRQRMAWALQTEAKVRLAKVQDRDSLDQIFHTLDSRYLFDVYPDVDDATFEEETTKSISRPRADIHALLRTSHSSFRQSRNPDASLVSLPELDMSTHQRHHCCLTGQDKRSKSVHYQHAPVPPNLLFFKIILQAYMGYKWKYCHPTNPTFPRCGILGGSVVAALTAWRDPQVRALFAQSNLEAWLDDPNRTDKNDSWRDYKIAKLDLVRRLNDWFLYKGPRAQTNLWSGATEPPQSPFSTGDADIFLQASPLTRSLVQKLKDQGLPADLRKKVESFIGGCGFLQDDLKRLVDSVFAKIEVNYNNEHSSHHYEFSDTQKNVAFPETSKFLFALSENALSSALTTESSAYESEGYGEDSIWPRNTQMIRLSEKADLVGALMDFDISVVGCSFDGNSVRVLPRAAFSLVTLCQVVTPFILEEKRNWQRIVKYHSRGFRPFVIDPNCSHETQCAKGPFGFCADRSQHPTYKDLERFYLEGGRTRKSLCPHGGREFLVLFENPESNVIDFFAMRDKWSDERRSQIESVHPWLRMCCSKCMHEYRDHLVLESVRPTSREVTKCQNEKGTVMCCCGSGRFPYSLILFEKEKGDGLNYFAKKYLWSETQRSEMQALDPMRLVSCRKCRYEYENYAYMKQHSEHGKRLEESTIDELLWGELVFRRQEGDSIFRPSFYSGGVFDGRRSRENPFFFYKALATLDSQLSAEKAQYLVKHGTYIGYKPRFFHGDDIDKLFQKASECVFPNSKRNPVGLNPERFVTSCQTCSCWMLECEYGAKHCEICQNA